jgi:DHA3 family macrolide efflux protein-like MFS transporter
MSHPNHAQPAHSTGGGRAWALPFFTIWGGQFFSLLGSQLVQFALVWWLTEETGSATVLAFATLIAMLPQVVLGPFAGTLVDRWNRRAVMLAADSLIALATLGLAILFATGTAATGYVYLAMLIRSIGATFHWPAMQASTTLMVPKQHLARVAGANQTLNGAMTIVAPPLGALLLDVLPIQGVLAIDISTALIAITPLVFITVPQPTRSESQRRASVRQDFSAGLSYVWSWPGLRVLLIMAMGINFCLFPAFSLMPILVTEHFGGEAQQFGWLQSVWGTGLAVGGIALSVWGGSERRVATGLAGLVGLGLGLALVGLTPGSAFGLALALMFFAGAMMPIHAGPLTAAIQASVTPEMQGRVITLIGSTTTLMAPISLAIAGPVSDAAGANVWYVLGGGLCVVMGAVGLTIPSLMHLEDNHRQAAPAIHAAGQSQPVQVDHY